MEKINKKNNDEYYMLLALQQANLALKNEDVPVGAVVVDSLGNVVAKAYNKKHKKNNSLYHAEIIAINKATKKNKDFRLYNYTLYVTFEPCLMCMGAIINARIGRLVIGAMDKRFSVVDNLKNINTNHNMPISCNVLEEECKELLSVFFEKLRQDKKNN